MNHTIEIIDEKVFVITESVQGPPGPSSGDAGSGGVASYVAGVAIGGHRAIILDQQDRAGYADNTNLGHLHRVVGITTSAADAGSAVSVVGNGPITEPSWNWNVTLPVFLGANGTLTQVEPKSPAAKFLMVVGFPISNTSLFVNIREPFVLT